jgi:hypothetical protein
MEILIDNGNGIACIYHTAIYLRKTTFSGQGKVIYFGKQGLKSFKIFA